MKRFIDRVTPNIGKSYYICGFTEKRLFSSTKYYYADFGYTTNLANKGVCKFETLSKAKDFIGAFIGVDTVWEEENGQT